MDGRTDGRILTQFLLCCAYRIMRVLSPIITFWCCIQTTSDSRLPFRQRQQQCSNRCIIDAKKDNPTSAGMGVAYRGAGECIWLHSAVKAGFVIGFPAILEVFCLELLYFITSIASKSCIFCHGSMHRGENKREENDSLNVQFMHICSTVRRVMMHSSGMQSV